MFKVMIPIDSDIDDLKDKIKEKGIHSSKDILAIDLVLWKVCYF